MKRDVDEDLKGAEFRECNLKNTRLIGVVMQGTVIDGLVTNLVVNGVEVMENVEAELDRPHPVRRLIRSDDLADVRRGWRQLRTGCAATVARMRQSPGIEHERVNDEWSAVQTLRHLVFVHDSWFRRCCLGSTDRFTPMGLGIDSVPGREEEGLDPSANPTLDEVLASPELIVGQAVSGSHRRPRMGGTWLETRGAMRSTGFKATSVLASAGGLLTNSGVDDAVDVLLMIVATSASGSNVHPEVVNAARPPLAREDRAIEAEIGRPAHRVAAT